MSNTQSNNIFAEFHRTFDLSELADCPQVEVLGCTYYVQTQALKVARDDGKGLMLNTRILLLEKPQHTAHPVVIGYLRNSHTLHSSDPETWDAVHFVAKVREAAEYFTADGYDFARKLIETLTPNRIIKGVLRLKGLGRKTKPHILKMCIFEMMRKETICVFQTEPIQLFDPPQKYSWDGVLYEFREATDDHGWIYAIYYPVGGIYHV